MPALAGMPVVCQETAESEPACCTAALALVAGLQHRTLVVRAEDWALETAVGAETGRDCCSSTEVREAALAVSSPLEAC